MSGRRYTPNRDHADACELAERELGLTDVSVHAHTGGLWGNGIRSGRLVVFFVGSEGVVPIGVYNIASDELYEQGVLL